MGKIGPPPPPKSHDPFVMFSEITLTAIVMYVLELLYGVSYNMNTLDNQIDTGKRKWEE